MYESNLKGDIQFYKRLYDTWSFSLLNWCMDIEGSESYTEQTAKFFSTLAPKVSFVCSKKHFSGDVCDV